MRYLLDTSAILRSPEVLARAKTHELLIPAAVVDELLERARPEPRSMLSSLLSQAMEAGASVVKGPGDAARVVTPADRTSYNLDRSDIEIAATAAMLNEQREGGGITVITLDKKFAAFLERNGIAWIAPSDFLALDPGQKSDQKTLASASSVTRSQRFYIGLSWLGGLGTALVGNIAYDNAQNLLTTAPVWGTLIGILIVGCALYWYRQRFRLAYGVAEFAVGFMTSAYVFYPTFDYAGIQVVHEIQLLGGLYVMVRGLDNIAKGVENTRLEPLWKRVFS